MKNPFLFIALNNYITKLVGNASIKNIQVISEGVDKGAIYYDLDGKTNKISPVEKPHQVVKNTAAGMLIMEGYVVVNLIDGTYIVSNNKGDTYFISGNSCSCADRFNPCKHMLFVDWFISFRKDQVNLLHNTRN
jgi:hypothetical protein